MKTAGNYAMPETPVEDGTNIFNGLDLGGRVRTLRRAKGLTLEKLCDICGVSRSALSKIENSQVSPTIEVLAKVAQGLEVDLTALLSTSQGEQPVARRVVTRRESAKQTETTHYLIKALADELTRKRMLPFYLTVKARELSEFDDWDRHESEDFLYVLEGTVVLHTEWYAPLTLQAGDSVYMDGRMGHALTTSGDLPAKVLWINTG